MFSFANPEYLYLLLLLPVVAGLFWFSQRAKAKKIAKFGRAGVVKELMPEQSKYKPWIRLTVELVLLATIVVILARPRGGAQETNTTMKGIEVMICLDVSNSMNAASDDDAPDVSRLQRSKQVLEKLIDRITGNKVGLIVFAGNAYMQMPITGDAQSAKMYLSSINTDMVPTQGTAIGAAINMACQCFSSNPRTQKTIIVITDGENFEDDAVSSAEDARKKGISVNVVGIGSVNGSPVPTADGEVLTDENGSPAISKLNEKGAMEIAKGGKGVYVNGAASDAVDALNDQLMKLSKTDLGSYNYSLESELFPIFARPQEPNPEAIQFLHQKRAKEMKYSTIYIVLSVMSITWLCACSSHNDGNKPAESTKAERNFIVEGNEQYAQGNYTEAEAAYRKALTENPNSAMAQFNLASALLRQDPKMGKNAPAPVQPQQTDTTQQEQMSEQLQHAVEILKSLVESSTEPAVVSVAAYDLGNISYKQQDYGQAIECYKEALRKKPKYDDARYNLRMAQLKQKDKNKNQNKNQNQNKDKNKDQNKDKNKDKDKDKQNQDKKDQNKDQDKNQDKQNQQQQQQQQQKGGMSQQNMEQILRTMQNQENATQQRVNAARAKQQQGERARTRNKW